MSKIIISAAIRGAHKVVKNAAQKLDDSIAKYGPQQEIGYPDTAYFLPIIYSLMGVAVKNLKDAKGVMDRCVEMLPPIPAEKNYLPYLGPGSGCRSGYPVCRRNLRGHPYPGTA